MNWPALSVFLALFVFVTGIGFWAGCWASTTTGIDSAGR